MKTLTILIALISISFSQSVNLTGIVTDTGNTLISGATVTVLKRNLSTVTNSNGQFAIQFVSVTNLYADKQKTLKISINRKVSGKAYDLSGRIINRTVVTGCFIEAAKGSEEKIIIRGSGRQAIVDAVNDTIVVTKAGYWSARTPITSYMMSGISITISDTSGSIQDTNGNVYQTVVIGGRTWMRENYRCTRLSDTAEAAKNSNYMLPIFDSQDNNTDWANMTTYAGCYYNDIYNSDSVKKYGILYNWRGAMAVAVPDGWHIPSDTEWGVLYTALAATGGIPNDPYFNLNFPGTRSYKGGFTGKDTSFDYWSRTVYQQDTTSRSGLEGDVEALGITGRPQNINNGYSLRLIKDK
jgi:hypothetical protein